MRHSYSAWSVFKSCARKYKAYIDGNRGPPSYASNRGNLIHKKLENSMLGKIKGTPPELHSFGEEIANVRTLPGLVVEQFWGVNQKWEKSDKDDTVWTMKMDIAVTPSKVTDMDLIVIDGKTGREYASHVKQGHLYGTIGMTLYPKARGAHVEFWYFDGGYSTQMYYPRSDLSKMQRYWSKQAKDMESEKDFLPSPSLENCKWCYLRSDKGGKCQAWRKVSGLV